MASKKMEALGSVVERVLGDKLVSSTLALDELTIVCKAADLTDVATTLRDHAELSFEQLIDLCGMDYSTYRDEPWDGPRFAAVYHLLSLLESDAAGVVAGQANAAQLAELQALHDDLETSVGDRERFFRVNEAFHRKLLEVANNRWRDQMVSDLRKVMKLNRHKSLFRQGRIEDSLAEHEAIMQALLARSPQAAAEAVRTHFQNGLLAAT